jgi:hypothetical protein
MRRVGGASDVQSGVSYLSKAKLQGLEEQADLKSRIDSKLMSVRSEVQSGVTKSQVASQAASIAPSKMKSTVSKLDKIVEENGEKDDTESLFLGETCKLNNLFMISNHILFSYSCIPQRLAQD